MPTFDCWKMLIYEQESIRIEIEQEKKLSMCTHSLFECTYIVSKLSIHPAQDHGTPFYCFHKSSKQVDLMEE